MIAQTIEFPTISVMSSMEKTVVRIMAIAVDSIMMGRCLRQFRDLRNRSVSSQWASPMAHTRSRPQRVTENFRSKPIDFVNFHKIILDLVQ